MGLRTRNKIKTLGITEVIINRTLKKKVRIMKRLGKGAMFKYPIKILLRELLGKNIIMRTQMKIVHLSILR